MTLEIEGLEISPGTVEQCEAVGWRPAYAEVVSAVGMSRVVFVSGQTSVDEDGALIGRDDIETQVRIALDNLEARLAAAGASLDNIVKLTCYLTKAEHAAPYSAEKSRRFSGEPFPASSTIVCELLGDGALIELEGIAVQ